MEVSVFFFMKMVDIDYYAALYDIANDVSEEIARLDFPQRYVRLVDNSGRVFDLEVAEVSKDEVLLMIKE